MLQRGGKEKKKKSDNAIAKHFVASLSPTEFRARPFEAWVVVVVSMWCVRRRAAEAPRDQSRLAGGVEGARIDAAAAVAAARPTTGSLVSRGSLVPVCRARLGAALAED